MASDNTSAFRRRDGPILPSIYRSPVSNKVLPGIAIYAGVFKPGDDSNLQAWNDAIYVHPQWANKESKLFQNIFRAYSFGIFMFISLMEHNVLATRILMLFKPLEILMILLIIKASKDTFTRISVFLIYLIPYSIQFYIIINHPDFYYNTKF